jgi:hypothetical protein
MSLTLEVEIRSLKAEIASLKEVILHMTADHEREVLSLTREVERLRLVGSSSGSPTKKEEELTEELQELRNLRAEDRAKYSSDSQKEVSLLRFEIAELKNTIASKEAHNAELTLYNIELSHKIQTSEEHLQETHKQIEECQHFLERRFSTFYTESRRRHHRVLKSLGSLINGCSSLSRLIGGVHEWVDRVWSELRKYKSLLHGNVRAVEYLLNSLSLMAGLPKLDSIDVHKLISHPDEIIALVDTASSACSQERSVLREQLRSTSKSLSDSLSMLRRPPISEPVVRVLTNLGSVILDVHSQLEEEHAGTLRLFSMTESDGGSLNFEDDD